VICRYAFKCVPDYCVKERKKYKHFLLDESTSQSQMVKRIL